MNERRPKRFPLAEVVNFCVRNDTRGLCFGGWEDSLLEVFLGYYNQDRGVFLAEDDGDMVGIGVGWRCDEDDLHTHWTRWNDGGDCLFISSVICKNREALRAIVEKLSERCPGWRSLKLLAKRNGRMKQYSAEFIERLGRRI